MFRSPKSISFDVGDQIIDLVCKEAGNADQTSNTNCQKAEADFTEIETVDGWVNKRKHFEERVVDAVGK